ncbi:MAG: argininosuccinate lyase, partial [Syntrophomonadaceae bacterium]|nr:argininosuccinate lyase [Syntrophomonadaceae bacterium]
VLTVMKGLPLAYNKDMQEDKEALFDAVDTLSQCLQVFTPMLRTLKVRRERLAQAAAGGFSNATDLADYLVRKGVPFRTAHEVVGRAVLYCLQHGLALDEVPLATLKEFSPFIEEDVYPQPATCSCG